MVLTELSFLFWFLFVPQIFCLQCLPHSTFSIFKSTTHDTGATPGGNESEQPLYQHFISYDSTSFSLPKPHLLLEHINPHRQTPKWFACAPISISSYCNVIPLIKRWVIHQKSV